jgi:hypothetical protein
LAAPLGEVSLDTTFHIGELLGHMVNLICVISKTKMPRKKLRLLSKETLDHKQCGAASHSKQSWHLV